ncbi:60S ribosomal protein L32 [Manis javanica]|nr:60S ribosomal protein L32 [Manis javanica]
MQRRFKGQLTPKSGYGSEKKMMHMLPGGSWELLVHIKKLEVTVLLMCSKSYGAHGAQNVSSKNRKAVVKKKSSLWTIRVTNPNTRLHSKGNERTAHVDVLFMLKKTIKMLL